jgi:hypothetical protein
VGISTTNSFETIGANAMNYETAVAISKTLEWFRYFQASSGVQTYLSENNLKVNWDEVHRMEKEVSGVIVTEMFRVAGWQGELPLIVLQSPENE